MPVNLDTLKLQLTKHEGCRFTPYQDAKGVWSVGIGRNLEDVGISREEARAMGKPAICGRVTMRPWGPSLAGRNVSELVFTVADVKLMFENDVDDRIDKLAALIWFPPLDDVRARVVLDMAFNLGFGGFMGFKETIAAIKAGDYKRASDCMLSSRWALQVPARAKRLGKMMATGNDPDWAKVT